MKGTMQGGRPGSGRSTMKGGSQASGPTTMGTTSSRTTERTRGGRKTPANIYRRNKRGY